MKTLLILGHKSRPWGYEVRVDLQDDLGRIYNEVLNFPARGKEGDRPDQETIAKAVDELAARVAARLAAQAEESALEPVRRALETKAEFMAAVSAGLIKADDAVKDLEPYVTVRPVEPVRERA
jgi:hypothetical protein